MISQTTTKTPASIFEIFQSICEDQRQLEQGAKVGQSGLIAPRIGGSIDKKTRIAKKIARLLFPNSHSDRHLSYIRYGQLISKIRRVYAEQNTSESDAAKPMDNPFRLARLPGNRQLFEQLLSEPVSRQIAYPEPMPVSVAPLNELKPIFCSVRKGASTKKSCQVYDRGAIYNDGRIDMCKQVVGEPYIGNLTESVSHNSSMRHFLLGNNVVGDKGACDIAKMLKMRESNSPIETLYLAGNCFTAKGAEYLSQALSKNRTAKSLWLKRNPLGVDGAGHIAEMLKQNESLETLDLVNTAIGDQGVEFIFEALLENKTLKTIYLDANALTSKGCLAIAKYFSGVKKRGYGITGLFLGINRIGCEGATILAESLLENLCLERLELCSNRIQVSGLKAILKGANTMPNLKWLGLGLYKSTSDLGELPNYFDGEGASVIANFIINNRSLQGADFRDTNLQKDQYHQIANALELNENLFEFGCSQFGLQIPKEIRDSMNRSLERNVQTKLGMTLQQFRSKNLRFLKHTPEVRWIDSIYRNNM